MHEGWQSGMVAMEENRFIVQSLRSSMMMTMTSDKEETLGEYIQSTKQRKKIGNELRCREQEGTYGINN